MGFPPMERATHQKNWGTPLRQAIVERVPGIDADTFMEMHNQVLPDFLDGGSVDTISNKNIETLRELAGLRKRLAILTSRTFNEAKHLLDKNHHINRYIEKIYHMDNNEFHKPDPRAFSLPLKDFEVAPDEVVYVGDSLNDGISSKGANLHFIALLESGLKNKSDFKDIDVDFFASDFSDIIDYINKS